MRCLAAGYEERRRQRRRCTCYGGGVQIQVPVAIDVDVDGVRYGNGRWRGGLWTVARTLEVPEPAQDETAGVPATRTQRQRVLDNGQWPVGGPSPTERFPVHGVGAQLQRGYRVQR